MIEMFVGTSGGVTGLPWSGTLQQQAAARLHPPCQRCPPARHARPPAQPDQLPASPAAKRNPGHVLVDVTRKPNSRRAAGPGKWGERTGYPWGWCTHQLHRHHSHPCPKACRIPTTGLKYRPSGLRPGITHLSAGAAEFMVFSQHYIRSGRTGQALRGLGTLAGCDQKPRQLPNPSTEICPALPPPRPPADSIPSSNAPGAV